MKKLIPFLLLCLVFSTGCKKNRKCDCIYTDGDKDTFIIVNETKNGAKNLCGAKSDSDRDCQLQ